MTFVSWLRARGHNPEKLSHSKLEFLRARYEAERPTPAPKSGPALGIKAGAADMPLRFIAETIGLKAKSKSADDAENDDEDDPECQGAAEGEEHDGPTRGAVADGGTEKTPPPAGKTSGAALPTFTMRAYTGGKMTPMGWGLPVVIDLDSVIVAKQQLPAPYGHDLSDPDSLVGHTTSIKVTTGVNGGIDVEGIVSGTGKRAEQVKSLVANKFPFQASVGGQPESTPFVEAGLTVMVNGREFDGPLYVAKNTVIGEISFVPLGADMQTSANVAASQGKGKIMNFSQWLQARGKDESKLGADERVKLIASFHAEMGIDPKSLVASGGGLLSAADIQLQAGALAEATTNAGRVAAANELDRQTAIRAACTKVQLPASFEYEEGGVKTTITNLEAHAVRHNWSADKAELVALRNGRNGTTPDGQVSASVPSFFIPSKPESGPAVLEAAILATGKCKLLDEDFYQEKNEQTGRMQVRAGFSNAERKRIAAQMNGRYTDQIQQYAHDLYKGRIGLHQVLAAGAHMNGFGRVRETIRDNDDLETVLRCAFERKIQADGSSMASLSNVLANVMNKFMLQGYWMVEMAWKEFCGIASPKDFKPSKSINLWGDFEFKDLGPDDELTHGTISDQAFANQVATSGRMGLIPRTHLINDDLGILTTMPMIVGRGGGLKVNKQVYTKLLNPGKDDGGSTDFFAATHTITGQTATSNYITGATTVLGSAGLTAAELAFDNQTDPNGDPLGIDAEILLYPSDLKVTAWELLNSEFIVYGGASAAKQGNKNRFVGAYKGVMSRYLNKTNAPYTNGSSTAWYLFADPGVMPVIQVAFLNGQETPTVQSVQADFNRLGIALRGFFDTGVNMQNFRGGVKSKGAA